LAEAKVGCSSRVVIAASFPYKWLVTGEFGAGPSESIGLASVSPASCCVSGVQRKQVTLSRILLVHPHCGPGRDESKVSMLILFVLTED